MSSFTVWNWMTYAALVVAAVAIAIETALRRFPVAHEAVVSSSWGAVLGFAPIVFVSIATLIFIAQLVGFVPSKNEWSDHLEIVDRKSFKNETVVIDGKSFNYCVFENVTLEYRGTGRVSFIDSKFGIIKFRSSNKAVATFASLIDNLRSDGVNLTFNQGPLTPNSAPP